MPVKPCRQRLRGFVQFAKGQNGFFVAAIGEEHVGAFVGLRCCALREQRHERGKCFHFGDDVGRRVAALVQAAGRAARFPAR